MSLWPSKLTEITIAVKIFETAISNITMTQPVVSYRTETQSWTWSLRNGNEIKLVFLKRKVLPKNV